MVRYMSFLCIDLDIVIFHSSSGGIISKTFFVVTLLPSNIVIFTFVTTTKNVKNIIYEMIEINKIKRLYIVIVSVNNIMKSKVGNNINAKIADVVPIIL